MAQAPPKNLREQQKEFTRSRLIATARELLSERGYVAVTVDDIVAAAGASRATFYLHFPTKADIAIVVAEADRQNTRKWYTRLDEVLAAGTRSDLTVWFQSVIKYYDENARVVAALREAAYVEEAVRADFGAFVRQGMESMPLYLERWHGSRSREGKLRLKLMIHHFDHFLERRGNGFDDSPSEMVAEVMSDIWWPALQP